MRAPACPSPRSTRSHASVGYGATIGRSRRRPHAGSAGGSGSCPGSAFPRSPMTTTAGPLAGVRRHPGHLDAGGPRGPRHRRPGARGRRAGQPDRTPGCGGGATSAWMPTVLVVAGATDQVCAALGAGLAGRETSLVGTGSWENTTVILDQPLGDTARERGVTWGRFPGGRYSALIMNPGGGAVVRWFREQLGEPGTPDAADPRGSHEPGHPRDRCGRRGRTATRSRCSCPTSPDRSHPGATRAPGGPSWA